MIQILRTDNLEGAARELASRYPRVLVRNKNLVWNPIRLRRARLQDLEPHIVLNPPAFDAQLAEWNRVGGMLIYDRSYMRSEDIAAHEAQLVVECPLALKDLEGYLDGTRDLGVVYRPPRWDEHRRCVADLWPSAERCQAFYELVLGAAEDVGLRERLGFTPGFHTVSDEAACTALQLTPAQLWRVRNACFRKRDYKMVTRVIPRIAPPDRTLSQVYAYIVNQFPELAGVRLIVGSALMKAARFWKVVLRDLARCGAVELKETLFCYYPDKEFPPHWFKIDAEHRRAAERLDEVIAFVEASPELNLPPASPSPRSLAPAARSRSTSSA